MWTEYMKDAEMYDKRDAEDWTGDLNGFLAFVRPTSTGPAVHPNDKLEDWSFLRNRWRIYHRILQTTVTR